MPTSSSPNSFPRYRSVKMNRAFIFPGP